MLAGLLGLLAGCQLLALIVLLVKLLVVISNNLADFHFLSRLNGRNLLLFQLSFLLIIGVVFGQKLVVFLVFKLLLFLSGSKCVLTDFIFPVKFIKLHELLV